MRNILIIWVTLILFGLTPIATGTTSVESARNTAVFECSCWCTKCDNNCVGDYNLQECTIGTGSRCVDKCCESAPNAPPSECSAQ